MEKQRYSARIKASKEKVWRLLWGKETYPKWTAAFAENSDAVTDWKEGSKVLFTNGSGEGMVARIATKIENEFLSFEHLGMLKNGQEILEGPEVEAWAGARENYTLTEYDNSTNLDVDIDVNPQWKDYFDKTWPKALEKLKELAEN